MTGVERLEGLPANRAYKMCALFREELYERSPEGIRAARLDRLRNYIPHLQKKVKSARAYLWEALKEEPRWVVVTEVVDNFNWEGEKDGFHFSEKSRRWTWPEIEERIIERARAYWPLVDELGELEKEWEELNPPRRVIELG